MAKKEKWTRINKEAGADSDLKEIDEKRIGSGDNRNERPEEERPFWQVDRDLTNRFSTETVADRQPVAEPLSPVSSLDPEEPDAAKRAARMEVQAYPQTVTTDQLRNRIDAGETRDKVKVLDPATSPLGTDAEAGGNPPIEAEVAAATQIEQNRQTVADDRTPMRQDKALTSWLVVGMAILLLALLGTMLGIAVNP